MLKGLLRTGAVAVTLFLASVASLGLVVTQEAFPANGDYSLSLDFHGASLSKAQAVTGLDEVGAAPGVFLAKVAPDPRHFTEVRDLIEFGRPASAEAGPVNWFDPALRGEVRPSTEVGTASLDGRFVLRGSEQALDALTSWAGQHGVAVDVVERSLPRLLILVLVDSGAGLVLAVVLVLIISLAAAFSAVRSRERTFRVVAGESPGAIVAGEVRSLVGMVAPPTAVAAVAAVIATAFLRGVPDARGAVNALLLLGVLTPAVVAFVGAIAIAVTLLALATWPRVDDIASRRAPEHRVRRPIGILRFAALGLCILLLPASAASATRALDVARQEAEWEPLSTAVSIRLSATGAAESEETFRRFGALAAAADVRNGLLFSYVLDGYESPRSQPFDGVVLTNPAFLRAMTASAGIASTAERPLGDTASPLGLDDIDAPLRENVTEAFRLWTRDGGTADGLTSGVRLFGASGKRTIPAVASDGTLRGPRHPLVVVVDRPSATFDDGFLNATVSTSNILFADASWLVGALPELGLANDVAFVDRVADTALGASRDARRSAAVTLLGALLVIVSLAVSVVISARIHALISARRSFLERTAGWSWRRIVAARLGRESAGAGLVTAGGFLAALSSHPAQAGWVLLALPAYLLCAGLVQVAETRSAFAATAARRS